MHRPGLFATLLVVLSCGGVAKKNAQAPEPATLSEAAYIHYLRGQLAHFRGDFAEARKELATAKREAPDQAPIARALSEAHYNAGNRKAAEDEAARATQEWPTNAQVWMQSGILHTRAREFAAAARSFERAIKLGVRGDDAYLAHGNALVQIGNLTAAKHLYRKLTLRESGSAEAHYQLALLLRGEANHKAASKHAQRATTEAPYDLRAWALLANTLRAQGLRDEADDALRRPFDRSRGNPDVGEQLFVELLDLGARGHALASVAILDRDDLPIDTRIGMGHWLLRAGDFDGALAVAGRLDATTPGTAAIVELRARALRALGRHDKALVELKRIGEGDSGYPLMQSMLAEILADTEKTDEARSVITSALALHPDHPDLVMAQAAIEEAAGNIEEARNLLSTAVSRHPGAPRPLFALAEVEARNGRSTQAIATITPLLRSNPRSFAALNYIGYILISNEKARERSRDLLLRALELAPDSAFVIDSYGWFLVQTGQLQKAAPLIERAVRLTPTDPELVLHLAELRWLEGRRKEADLLLKRARSLALAKHSRQAVAAVRNRLTQ